MPEVFCSSTACDVRRPVFHNLGRGCPKKERKRLGAGFLSRQETNGQSTQTKTLSYEIPCFFCHRFFVPAPFAA
ncbi:MAG TPA: hypothetical protein PKH43_12495, partial [Saprospiraceae bacterium]|nr:hypothetical protein [Saprospiraceae bacterium]